MHHGGELQSIQHEANNPFIIQNWRVISKKQKKRKPYKTILF